MKRLCAAAFLAVCIISPNVQAADDPLPSWNDGAAKSAINEFVHTTTDQSSPKFVPPEERIATFDQDGTLWVEHPIYTQVIYCLDRVPAVVREKPELGKVEPFKTVLSGDREAMARLSMSDLLKILAATSTGMSVDEFATEVKKWLVAARISSGSTPRRCTAFRPNKWSVPPAAPATAMTRTGGRFLPKIRSCC